MSITLALLLAQFATQPTPPDQTAGPAPVPVAQEGATEGERVAGRLGTAQQGGGDIVVTARRRAETVQQVPIAISVIGGQALADTGAYNVNRLTQLQPSLQFYSTNPRNSAANIRGLGAPFGLTNDGIEQGVGIYVDQSITAALPRRRSTLPIPSGLRSCAGRKERCTGRTRPRVRSTLRRANRASRPRRGLN